MKNTKGFTLIELLAVIVILAIIALIATPMILGVINDARKGSAQNAALGYIDSVEKSMVTVMFQTSNDTSVLSNGTYTVSNSGATITNNTDSNETLTVNFKGDTPKDGSTITISNGAVTAAKLQFDKIYGYAVNCTSSGCTASDSEKIS